MQTGRGIPSPSDGSARSACWVADTTTPTTEPPATGCCIWTSSCRPQTVAQQQICLRSQGNASRTPPSCIRNRYVTSVQTVKYSVTPNGNVLNRLEEFENSTSVTSGFRQARVVGGRDALPGEYCWQVRIVLSTPFPQ